MQTAKADAGKLELDLVPTQILRDIAEVRMYGNKKYGDPNNWKKVELRRYINALMRHALAFLEDNDGVDEESRIKHYKHMACNMAFICHMMKQKEAEKECEHDWMLEGASNTTFTYVCRKCRLLRCEEIIQ